MRRVAALLFLLALPLAAQVVMEEVGTLTDQLEKAGDAFKSYKFDKSVETLNALISTLEDWEKNGSLQESDEALYKKALEIRAVSYFHLGKEPVSKEDFTRLIKMDPDFNLEVTSSTKILRFYNSIRDAMAGTLVLEISPPETNVAIDGKSFPGGRTIRLLEGIHILKASAMGYNSLSKEIQIQSGKSVQELVILKPNARKIYFFLKPQGAKLFVDGRLAGSADVPANAKDEWAQYVSGNNLSPAQFFAIEALYLSPGDHKIEIVAPCFTTRKFSIPVALDAAENKPGYIKPIELEKETILLKISSHPDNALVEIDGQKYGNTPVEIKDFCSGNHVFRVSKEGQGEYNKRLELRGIPSFELTARLRPTLLWLGMAKDQEVPADACRTFEESMKAALPDIPSFNLVFSEEDNPFLADTFFTKGVSVSEQRKTLRNLCSKYKAEGVLVSKLTSEGDKSMVSFRLYAPDIDGFDETKTLLLDAKDPSPILRKFDSQKDEPLSDLVLQNDGNKGLLVLRAGTCRLAVVPGDRLISVDEVEPKDPKEALKMLGSLNKPVRITYQRGPEAKTAEIKNLPKIVLYHGSQAGYHKLWLIYNQEIISSEDGPSLAVSKLNLASVEISLGRNDKALELLNGLALSGDTECLVPTMKYLRAVALLHKGQRQAAKEELTNLKNSYKDSYLGNDGIILLLPLVEDLLNNLN